jgi:hypothetical protein
MRPALVTSLRFVVGLFLIVLLVSEASLYFAPLKPSLSITVSFVEADGRIISTTRLTSSYAGSFRQVYLDGSVSSVPHTIYYYYDSGYSTADAGLGSWFGFPHHLEAVVSQRGLPISVDVVNAAQLASVLGNSSTTGDLIVMASGAFPSTVFSRTTNLVSPWLEAGGKLYWIGAPIGYYSAQFDTPVRPGPSNPGAEGVDTFVNSTWLGGPSTRAPAFQNSTLISAALNLLYPYGVGSSYELDVQAVTQGGGQVVGPSEGSYSNAALIPYGSGGIVDIAAALIHPYEDDLSISLANMIQLGVFDGPIHVLGISNVTAAAESTVTWTYSVTSQDTNYCVFTQQTDSAAMFGSLSCFS